MSLSKVRLYFFLLPTMKPFLTFSLNVAVNLHSCLSMDPVKHSTVQFLSEKPMMF